MLLVECRGQLLAVRFESVAKGGHLDTGACKEHYRPHLEVFIAELHHLSQEMAVQLSKRLDSLAP